VTTPSSDKKETPAVPVNIDEPTANEAETATEAPDVTELTDSDATEGIEANDAPEGIEANEADEFADAEADTTSHRAKSGFSWERAVAFGVLPVVALALAGVAGYLKWEDNSVRSADTARTESTQVAKDSSVRLLSYKPDTVEQDLGSARELLTGAFADSYTQLTTDVVIPGSKEKQISAVASVPAVASISATPDHAVALVFVNQTVIVGTGAPTATASSVKVTMEKIDGRWLISGFDPV
jgi:Mce-associated membrane protein